MVRSAVAILVLVLGVLVAAAPNARAGDPEAGKAKVAASGCAECHGELGISVDPSIPNLAGQNEAYLIKQLSEFRRPPSDRRLAKPEARRSDHIMNLKAAHLTDTDVADLAAWFATLWCGSSGRETAAERPKVAARCTTCHGPSGMSEEDEVIPKLAGQKRGYLAKQLHLFRASARGTVPDTPRSERFHPLMDTEAVRLADADIDALAGYFAGQSCW